MKNELLIAVIIFLAPFVAWRYGVLELDKVGIILVGIALLYLVIGLLSRMGLSVPRGDATNFSPISTSSQIVSLGLIGLIVGALLIWLT
jgi:hypothetical protein